MALPVKYLLCKHQNLSLITRTHVNIRMLAHACKAKVKISRSLVGACLAYLASPRPVREPVSKNKVDITPEDQYLSFSSGHTHIQADTDTHVVSHRITFTMWLPETQTGRLGSRYLYLLGHPAGTKWFCCLVFLIFMHLFSEYANLSSQQAKKEFYSTI